MFWRKLWAKGSSIEESKEAQRGILDGLPISDTAAEERSGNLESVETQVILMIPVCPPEKQFKHLYKTWNMENFTWVNIGISFELKWPSQVSNSEHGPMLTHFATCVSERKTTIFNECSFKQMTYVTSICHMQGNSLRSH